MSDQTVSVASVSSRAEADIVAGLLRGAGIDARVSADDAGGEIGSFQLQGVSVLVAKADEVEARRILAS
jgi:putative signal transducing protein